MCIYLLLLKDLLMRHGICRYESQEGDVSLQFKPSRKTVDKYEEPYGREQNEDRIVTRIVYYLMPARWLKPAGK
jgi:hypothetical protein